MADFSVVAKILADSSGFAKGVAEAKQSLSSLSGNAFKQIGQIGDAMSSVGSGMTNAISLPVATGVAAAVRSFGDLEQAIGGVETLFKGSANTVIRNSETAYKRAGISGTKYMEQVTSFSATLLQGLGGDTKEAARYADMAITDMADNANKFGTSIADIQNAYQGFAKDNYTMLDNLKLGYGGTQAEMARLVNESGVLNGEFEATAENIKDIPFDKLIEAINVTQKRLGITGTTAKEAAETVNGSFSTMVAAAKNLLSGLGNVDANVKELFKNLYDSVLVFVSNVKRVLLTIWDNLPIAEWQKWVGLITALSGPVMLVMGKIFTAVSKIPSAFAALKTALTVLTGPIGLTIALIGVLAGVFIYLWKTNEQFREKVLEIWGAVKEFISQTVEQISTVLKSTWDSILSWWETNQESILSKASEVWNQVLSVAQTVADWFSGVFSGLWESLLSWWKTNQESFKTVSDEVWVTLQQIFKGALETIKGIFDAIWGPLSSWFIENNELIKQTIDTVWNEILGVISGIINEVVPSVINGWNMILDFTKPAWDLIMNVIKIAMELILGTIKAIMQAINGDWKGAWETVKSTAKTVWDLTKNAFITYMTSIRERALSILSAIARVFQTKWNEAKTTTTNIINNIKSAVQNGFNQMLNRIKSSMNRVVSSVREGWNNALSAAKSFISRAVSIGANIISGFVQGVREAAGRLVSAVSGAVGSAIDKAKSLLGIHSPSRVFKQFGIYTDEGFIQGINSLANKVKGSVESMVNGAINAGDKAALITPSFMLNDLESFNQSLNSMINGSVSHSVSVNGMKFQERPIELSANFVLGGQEYRGFVSNITTQQGRDIILESY